MCLTYLTLKTYEEKLRKTCVLCRLEM